MRSHRRIALLAAVAALAGVRPAEGDVPGDFALLQAHCAPCHKGSGAPAGFRLDSLADAPGPKNLHLWEVSLAHVRSERMPPAAASGLSPADRRRLVSFLERELHGYRQAAGVSDKAPPRRLNNRELANSVRDVLMLDHIGTHRPMANLLADTLRDGFDTSADALGLNQFYLERCVDAFRSVLDAAILPPEMPQSRLRHVRAADMNATSLSQAGRPGWFGRTEEGVDFLARISHQLCL